MIIWPTEPYLYFVYKMQSVSAWLSRELDKFLIVVNAYNFYTRSRQSTAPRIVELSWKIVVCVTENEIQYIVKSRARISRLVHLKLFFE